MLNLMTLPSGTRGTSSSFVTYDMSLRDIKLPGIFS
jgi:hypothetical protein